MLFGINWEAWRWEVKQKLCREDGIFVSKSILILRDVESGWGDEGGGRGRTAVCDVSEGVPIGGSGNR